jgi:hypothetical protein
MAKGANKTPTFRTTVVDLWQTVTSELFNTYHPERHYMRGPGPKCREKQAQVSTRTTDAAFGMTQAVA